METITAEEWKTKHKDYKTIINGQRHILKNIQGSGTCLVPVEVTGMKKVKKMEI
jgi:hypothetical protein